MCWTLLILGVCVSVGHCFCLDDGGLDFGECCCFILASYAPGNDADDAFSSWKMDVLFGMKRKHLFLVILHISDDFAILNTTKTIFKDEKAPSY
jgi:hypothetical protein